MASAVEDASRSTEVDGNSEPDGHSDFSTTAKSPAQNERHEDRRPLGLFTEAQYQGFHNNVQSIAVENNSRSTEADGYSETDGYSTTDGYSNFSASAAKSPTQSETPEDLRPLGLLTEAQYQGFNGNMQNLDFLEFRLHFLHQNFQLDDEDDFSIAEDSLEQFRFQQGPVIKSDCEVCMSSVQDSSRACCNQMVCDECTISYISVKIKEGNVHFACPAFGCDQPVSRDEIIARMTDETLLEKYHRFVTNANADPNKKTCPSCCAITTLDVQSSKRFGHAIICEQCSFPWCFDCHSPSHEGLQCKENKKGLSALKKWTKATSNGQRNARKCPKCKVRQRT